MLRPETKLWWTQAKRDFKIAEHNHERGDYEASVFFCEQAGQKALKPLLIHRTSKPPPKIHNLAELGKMVDVDKKMLDFLVELTPHYMMTRYPDAAGVSQQLSYTTVAHPSDSFGGQRRCSHGVETGFAEGGFQSLPCADGA